jgi:predicted DsbA family dithiol-disulfide isomerase
MVQTFATFPDDPTSQHPGVVWHWYDLICPFCYVGQARSAVFEQHRLEVVELGFEIHPETPAEGIVVGPRKGPMYEQLAHEAKQAGLPLRWPPRIVNSRRALSAVEWARAEQPEYAREFRASLFRAHFALEQDINDEATVLRHALDVGIAVDRLSNALRSEIPAELLRRAERNGVRLGVNSTPSWLVGRRLVRGLVTREQVEALARSEEAT